MKNGRTSWLVLRRETAQNSGRPTWLAPAEEAEAKVPFAGREVRSSIAPSMPPSVARSSYGPGGREPHQEFERPDSDEVPPPPSMPESSSLEIGELMGELRDTLDQAQLAVLAARRELLAQTEPEVVQLAIAIAERVVGRELATEPSVIAAWVREGLQAMAQEDQVVVRVSPQIGEHLERLGEELESERIASIVVSDQLQGPEVELSGRYGRVDAGLRARLDAVIEALGAEES